MTRQIDIAVESRRVADEFSLGFFFYVRSFGSRFSVGSERTL
jgi:hypothetical protein